MAINLTEWSSGQFVGGELTEPIRSSLLLSLPSGPPCSSLVPLTYLFPSLGVTHQAPLSLLLASEWGGDSTLAFLLRDEGLKDRTGREKRWWRKRVINSCRCFQAYCLSEKRSRKRSTRREAPSVFLFFFFQETWVHHANGSPPILSH